MSVPEPQGVVVGHVPRVQLDADPALEALLLRLFGVGDLEGVEDAHARTVELSPASTLACPMHGLTLKPDACRSCSFLAGDRTPATGK
jgi:hypothetical protein